MTGRFEYVKFEEEAAKKQQLFKTKVQEIEAMVEELPKSRSQSLALTKLEEFYMWLGKAIRDEQTQNE